MYKSNTFPEFIISLAIRNGEGRGPVLAPSPASWRRTLTMSMGCITVVAVMPARPPLMKGMKVRTY